MANIAKSSTSKNKNKTKEIFLQKHKNMPPKKQQSKSNAKNAVKITTGRSIVSNKKIHIKNDSKVKMEKKAKEKTHRLSFLNFDDDDFSDIVLESKKIVEIDDEDT